MKLRQETFNIILVKIFPQIELTLTNVKPNPTSTHRHLALTIYRLYQFHQLVYFLIKFVESLQSIFMICVLPSTDREWKAELKQFIGNYEFTCVGAWDGFHVIVSMLLKDLQFQEKNTPSIILDL